MRWLVSVVVILTPAIGMAASERPPVEPVKSETTQKLVLKVDDLSDCDGLQIPMKPPKSTKKTRPKKAQTKNPDNRPVKPVQP